MARRKKHATGELRPNGLIGIQIFDMLRVFLESVGNAVTQWSRMELDKMIKS